MSSEPSNAPADPTEQYRKGIQSYRDSVKWVVSSFGAVAAALVVGIQLTSLGSLHGERLLWAVISGGVVFAAVIAIVAAAVRVLAPIGATYTEFEKGRTFAPLRKFLQKDRAPLREKADSAKDLADKYKCLVDRENKDYDLFKANEKDETLKQNYLDTKKERVDLFRVVQAVTALGLHLRVKELFKHGMVTISIGVLLTAAGAISFAYWANPPAPKKLDCVGLYLDLDKLVDDDPLAAATWPEDPISGEAKDCGFTSNEKLTQYLEGLARH
jgi:hypothetical protein